MAAQKALKAAQDTATRAKRAADDLAKRVGALEQRPAMTRDAVWQPQRTG